ncbi:MAG: alpha/beta hydrolase [Dehalococcoidia bacterium]
MPREALFATPQSRRRFLGSMVLGAAGVALACTSSKSKQEAATPRPSASSVIGPGSFDSNGVRIHYEVTGTGRPIVLLHGWANNYQMNWVDTGWVETLSPLRQVIGVDQRGHGASDKPHDAASYETAPMASDIVSLLDHLKIDRADIFGYSMGGQVTAGLLAQTPGRVSAAIMGGVGPNFFEHGPSELAAVVDALLAPDSASVENETLRAVRDLYASQGNDLAALAAWLQADHFAATTAELADVLLPVLVVNSEADAEGAAVAAAFPGAQLEVIPGTNHISVVPDQRFKDRVVRFLNEIDAA